MKYTVLFFTHSGAIKFKRNLGKRDIVAVLRPVPRNLSSNCGICAELEHEGELKDIIDDEVEKIFDANEVLVYDAE